MASAQPHDAGRREYTSVQLARLLGVNRRGFNNAMRRLDVPYRKPKLLEGPAYRYAFADLPEHIREWIEGMSREAYDAAMLQPEEGAE